MEIGTPPLYAEANRCTRDLDDSEIEELGPFIRCLSYVSLHAENQKWAIDKAETGESVSYTHLTLPTILLV